MLALRGELVTGTAGQIRHMLATLVGSGAARIVVDAGGMAWADEAGLHMLTVARRNAAAVGVPLGLGQGATGDRDRNAAGRPDRRTSLL